jgi:hypothetical protein
MWPVHELGLSCSVIEICQRAEEICCYIKGREQNIPEEVAWITTTTVLAYHRLNDITTIDKS